MKIFKDISECRNAKNPILTLGMFDGVHIGHQAIIQELNKIAKANDGESTLLTFDPHPKMVLQKDSNDFEFLTTLDEKISLLEKFGLDNLILHPFTTEFANLESEEFVCELLVKQIGIHTIIIGYDHQFGKNRSGNFQQLKELSEKYGFQLIQLDEIKSGNQHISSTQIRKALKEGNLEFANKGLGRNYTISGTVVHGDKLGRTLGFPTANLEVDSYKLIPTDGVYIVKASINNKQHKGLLSIGNRPTVTNSNEKRVEVFLLDFQEEIYGEWVDLELIHFIRKDLKFNSLDELISQMNQDLAFAKEFRI